MNSANLCKKREQQIRYDSVGKVFQGELCKRGKFDHTTKWYTDKLKSFQEKETYKILCDFEMQTDHLIAARGPVFKKANLPNSELCRPSVKIKENEKRNRYLDLVRERKSDGTGK